MRGLMPFMAMNPNLADISAGFFSAGNGSVPSLNLDIEGSIA
jgi:hypothetical protein